MANTTAMTQQTHLLKRDSTYYFRARIPHDLQGYYGRAEHKLSLRTKDRREAVRLVREKSAAMEGEYAAIRARMSPIPLTPTLIDDALIQRLTERWRHDTLSGDEWYRSHGLDDAEFDERQQSREALLPELKRALARGQIETIKPALDGYLALLSIEPLGDEEAYRRLAFAFLQVMVETTEQQARRDAGEWVATPPAPERPVGYTVQTPQSGKLTLDELYENWVKAVPNRPLSTIDAGERVLRRFKAFISKPAETITKADIVAFRDHMTETESVAEKTIETRLSLLRAMFQVAVDDDKLSANPASRIKVRTAKNTEVKRLPYASPDLNAIFATSVYSEGERPKAGQAETAYWLPLLALFTGARIEELCQLYVMDVKEERGVHYLDIINITAKTDLKTLHERRLKNDASRRRMPIHPQILDLGFLDYVEQIRSQGELYLFPTMKPDRYGKRSASWSKWWGHWRRQTGISDRSKVFHSFRHSFRDACREAELDEEIADALMGHASTRTGRQYGSNYSLKRLDKAMRRISYPDVRYPAQWSARPW